MTRQRPFTGTETGTIAACVTRPRSVQPGMPPQQRRTARFHADHQATYATPRGAVLYVAPLAVALA
jgi:hypothetical protein